MARGEAEDREKESGGAGAEVRGGSGPSPVGGGGEESRLRPGMGTLAAWPASWLLNMAASEAMIFSDPYLVFSSRSTAASARVSESRPWLLAVAARVAFFDGRFPSTCGNNHH